MAHLDFGSFRGDLGKARRLLRGSDHVQRVQVMLLAACIATLGVVAVAGTMLANMF